MKVTALTITNMMLVGAMLIGCSPAKDKPASTATNSTTATTSATPSPEQKTLRIATEGGYRPFNYANADGSLGGFDVDISNALCADMKVKCQIVAQDWDGIIPGLTAKKYDAIVSAMSITPERQGQVDFTEPYFTNTLVFLAKKDSTFNPDDASQIDGHTVAAQRSTISSQWLGKTHPKAQAKLYDTLDNAFMDLAAGRAESMISDKAPAYEWLKSASGQNFAIKGKEVDINDKLAIAVRKGDPLKDQISQALAHIKADGSYDKIVQKHFGIPSGTAPVASSVASTTTSTTTTVTTTATSQPKS